MPRWVKTARKIHLLIALCIGLHFALIATTGAIYIFESELNQWARAERGWVSTEGDVGPDVSYAAIKEAFPSWRGTYLAFPRPDMPYYTTYVDGATDYFWTDVYVDPGTGRILGSVDNSSLCVEGILQTAIQLHINLCAGETGRRFVDASVVILLIEVLTGLMLWWRGVSRLHQAFGLRMKHNVFLTNYDLHRLLGVLTAPFLIVMILTGILWAYPQMMVPVVYWCCGETPSVDTEAYRLEEPSSQPVLLAPTDNPHSFARLSEAILLSHRDAEIRQLVLKHPRDRTATFSVHHNGTTAENSPPKEFVFDRLSGRLVLPNLPQTDPPTFADQLTNEWAHELHYGSFGGLTTKLLYLAACLSVNLLLFTGVTMWFIKRRKQSSVRRKKIAPQ